MEIEGNRYNQMEIDENRQKQMEIHLKQVETDGNR